MSDAAFAELQPDRISQVEEKKRVRVSPNYSSGLLAKRSEIEGFGLPSSLEI